MDDDFLRRARLALHDMQGRVEGGKLVMFERTIDYAARLEAEVERLRSPPEDYCAKCGAPRSNHPYRHLFVPRALSETEGE